jgi:hypothetical protein
MISTAPSLTAAAVVLALLSAAAGLSGRTPPAPHQQSAAPFVSLFDGTLRGWVVENTGAGNFAVRDGALRVEGPSGWLRSERQYQDFVLRTEFRFLTPDADSGVFVRASGEGVFMRGWPNNSYQVQLRVPSTPSRLPPVGGIFRHGMPPGETSFDAARVQTLFGGVGAWQTVEIEVAGETLAVRFNGTEVTRAANVVRAPGFIGIQGETGALEYRTIEMQER